MHSSSIALVNAATKDDDDFVLADEVTTKLNSNKLKQIEPDVIEILTYSGIAFLFSSLRILDKANSKRTFLLFCFKLHLRNYLNVTQYIEHFRIKPYDVHSVLDE